MQTSTAGKVLSWVLRITAAVILLQTLFFKFTAAPESVYIFTKVGAEPWGRIGSGIVAGCCCAEALLDNSPSSRQTIITQQHSRKIRMAILSARQK